MSTVQRLHTDSATPARSTPQTTPDDLAAVMDKYLTLHRHGMGRMRLPGWSWDKLERNREALRESSSRVALIVAWLKDNVRMIKTPSRARSSYSWKHIAERHMDGVGGYVANGELIAAALIAGYPMRASTRSPNVDLGMSERDARRLETPPTHTRRTRRGEETGGCEAAGDR